MSKFRSVVYLLLLLGAHAPFGYAAEVIPACRLDNSFSNEVTKTLNLSLNAFRSMGSPLAIDNIEINKLGESKNSKKLKVYLVKDAAKNGIDSKGCATRSASPDEELDKLSVRGGCYVVSVDEPELRCSRTALDIFGKKDHSESQQNPTLLYVLTHELAHLLQRRPGEYSGRTINLNITVDRTKRLEQLQANCDPVSIRKELEADEKAFAVMASLLINPPYKSTFLSEQGSMLWNIDRLAVAMDEWQKVGIMRELINQPEVHKSFVPTEFPTPSKTVDRNAKKFVCDALFSKKPISFPERSKSHPGIEQRLRNLIDVLKPLAKRLPTTGGSQEYKSIIDIHRDVSDITTHIFRETGVYTDVLDNSICTIVNSDSPSTNCQQRKQ